ncbi:hypothetical protein [Candidatus Manganitrophus noduliformans]|uniref:Outer membrane protein beta-barrel domain-containing protein n=1 Tax=Candidatus Manganitrophus noduliformans TaxID=2606439 RepID=A0A7X6DLB1_9BACT|nr:hypothetical protein [Candidatus Manganitrophus noduliformans]NKE69284.1 hypothetical protein [Candidatus Manganitrophus noduliformans]
MKRFQFMFFLVTVFIATMATSLSAAPIGVPGATAGANKSVISAELNLLTDRDLTGGGEVESTQAFAKGEVGLTDRVDLIIRLGVGDFEGGGVDTDFGPAFGVGFKTTWAEISDVNLKIGTVFQTTRIRAEDDSTRFGWAEYDAALGAFLDSRGSRQAVIPYGGVAWSALDVEGRASEDDAFGFFLGALARLGGNFQVGVEFRIVDQTAISANAGFVF